jgi:glycosyltransferase involved in cell wall biosynthesis
MAAVFIFPSLSEGFGWPIAEAQACGCPVLTTDAAPMNEVGGNVVTYIPALKQSDDPQHWAQEAAKKLMTLIALTSAERKAYADASVANIAKFDATATMSAYLAIYEKVLASANSNAQSTTRHLKVQR